VVLLLIDQKEYYILVHFIRITYDALVGKKGFEFLKEFVSLVQFFNKPKEMQKILPSFLFSLLGEILYSLSLLGNVKL
jgi:hypothetical protein